MPVARPSEWCLGAPVPRSPLVARAPPTFDDAFTGPPAHTPDARRDVRFGSRRTRRTGGHSRRRSRTSERTSELTKGRQGRPRSGVTNRATMIFGLEPERVRRDSSIRASPAIDRLPTHAGGDRSFGGVFRALRTSVGDAVRSGEFGRGERRATAAVPKRLRTRSLASSERSRAGWFPQRGSAGNREDAASGRRRGVGGSRRVPTAILPSVPGLRPGSSDRGGPAIARSGRVVRPVRRPSDRQSPRRRSGGDPREICNQVPSRAARDLSIHRARRRDVGTHGRVAA